jgi:hypothetical protein
MFFVNDFLKVNVSTEIPLKYVESIQFGVDEDLTADRLKGDRTFKVRMLSGIEYTVSFLRQMSGWQLKSMEGMSSSDLEENFQQFQDGIISKWKFNVTGVKE